MFTLIIYFIALNVYVEFVLIYRPHPVYSQYHDIESLSILCATQKRPVILSINIQSLQSKHEQLCLEINELVAKNIEIDAIVLQETWNIQYPEFLDIDGFKPLIFKNRRGMRGGGVGFYIKNNLSASYLKTYLRLKIKSWSP
jgi:hypothetical protein